VPEKDVQGDSDLAKDISTVLKKMKLDETDLVKFSISALKAL